MIGALSAKQKYLVYKHIRFGGDGNTVLQSIAPQAVF
jgi:hypothetical protein